MPDSVLVVDDEEVIRDILITWLREAGYEAHSAANGLEGLREMYRTRPDLIVADIMMPQIDGYEMCRLMRQISGVPIILLTGLGMERYKRLGLSMGADDYLTKPIGMDSFLCSVSNLLSRRQECEHPSSLQQRLEREISEAG
ncbi:MAG: response regulator [Chloroflexi bacterium]|nr:response regulator [Chloroflexota bacterium]